MANMKRESKAYSFEDQKREMEIRLQRKVDSDTSKNNAQELLKKAKLRRCGIFGSPHLILHSIMSSGNDRVQDQGPEESPTRSEQSQTDSRLAVEQEIDEPTPGDREEENGRGSLFPPIIDKEMRRKMASAK